MKKLTLTAFAILLITATGCGARALATTDFTPKDLDVVKILKNKNMTNKDQEFQASLDLLIYSISKEASVREIQEPDTEYTSLQTEEETFVETIPSVETTIEEISTQESTTRVDPIQIEEATQNTEVQESASTSTLIQETLPPETIEKTTIQEIQPTTAPTAPTAPTTVFDQIMVSVNPYDHVNPVVHGDTNAHNELINRANSMCSGVASDIEKISLIYLNLTGSISYNYETEHNGVDGDVLCVVSGRAKCADIAYAFETMVRSQGIPCVSIQGISPNGGTHDWNTCYVDGQWLMFDATWDLNQFSAGNWKHFGLSASVFQAQGYGIADLRSDWQTNNFIALWW